MRLLNLRTSVMKALAGDAVPVLSIGGNTFTLIDQDNTKVVSKIDEDGNLYVDVHIVDAAFNTSKMFWKEKFSQKEDEQKAPDCFSNDGVKPDPQSTEKQCTFCNECQWNVWGTAIGDQGTGKGKRCRDVWKVAVVVPSFSATALWQLRIPPASLKNWKAFMAQFSEFMLPTPDGGQREAHVGDVITRVYFEQGKQGVINFVGVEMVQPAQMNYLMEVQNKNTALHLIGGNMAQLPEPEKQAMIEGPKPSEEVVQQYATRSEQIASQIANEIAQEEEDEEAALQRKLAAIKAQKQAAAQQATTQAQSAMPKPKLPLNGGVTQAAKPAAPVTKPNVLAVNKPKGAMDLPAGMRTKMDMSAAKKNAVDAEIVHEKTEVQSPAGIPQSNMPSELQDMLKDVMGM